MLTEMAVDAIDTEERGQQMCAEEIEAETQGFGGQRQLNDVTSRPASQARVTFWIINLLNLVL